MRRLNLSDIVAMTFEFHVQRHLLAVASIPNFLSTSFLLHSIPLIYISQIPASGYSGFNFPDLSMSELQVTQWFSTLASDFQRLSSIIPVLLQQSLDSPYYCRSLSLLWPEYFSTMTNVFFLSITPLIDYSIF